MNHRKLILFWIVMVVGLTLSCRKVTGTAGDGPEIEWIRTYSGSGSFVFQTSDDGYFIVGSKSYLSKGYDLFIMKTTNEGDSIWAKHYGDPRSQHPLRVRLSSEKGLIINAYSLGEKPYCENFDMYIDSAGDSISATFIPDFKLPKKKFGSLSIDTSSNTICFIDNGGIANVECEPGRIDRLDIRFEEIDAQGHTTFSQSYNIAGVDIPYSIFPSLDKGYVIAGSGELFDSRKISIPKFFHNALILMASKCKFHSFALASIGIGIYADFYVFKVDSCGAILWERHIKSINFSDVYSCNLISGCTNVPPRFWENLSLQLTPDGGYIIAGFSERGGSPEDEDFYLIKLKPKE